VRYAEGTGSMLISGDPRGTGRCRVRSRRWPARWS